MRSIAQRERSPFYSRSGTPAELFPPNHGMSSRGVHSDTPEVAVREAFA